MARSARRVSPAVAAKAFYPQARPAMRDGNMMVKIRGLTVMALGAIAIGYGTGNLPLSVVSVFLGLALLLLGFTWLMA